MLLNLEIEAIKLGLGKSKSGAELTLADAARPRCLVPFSYYIGDVAAFEEAHKVKLTDLRFKAVTIGCTAMASSVMGNAIKLEGEFQLALNNDKASK